MSFCKSSTPANVGAIGLVAVLAFLTLGCSKEKRKQFTAAVQQGASDLAESASDFATSAVESATETVKEQLPATGTISLQSNPELKASVANIEVISVGDGRRNVVQIASYKVGSVPDTYPSIFLQGLTDAGDPASLSESSVECELFVQASANAPIAATTSGEKIKVSFSKLDPAAKSLTASVSNCSLLDTENKTTSISGGQIVAIFGGQ